jgi:uncharacterized protein YjbI with pentapeptide repeats
MTIRKAILPRGAATDLDGESSDNLEVMLGGVQFRGANREGVDLRRGRLSTAKRFRQNLLTDP